MAIQLEETRISNPRTIYDILQLIESYHGQRRATYARLASETTNAMAQILLEHWVELEDYSLKVVVGEMLQLDPKHATYLTLGPLVSQEVTQASDCHSAGNPTFQAALACAFESDHLLDQLVSRLEECSSAQSVLDLANRLRDLEETKV